MLYNVVLVSALQCKSVIIILVYIYSLPFEPPSVIPFHPSRLSQNTRLGSCVLQQLPTKLSVLPMIVYICQCGKALFVISSKCH